MLSKYSECQYVLIPSWYSLLLTKSGNDAQIVLIILLNGVHCTMVPLYQIWAFSILYIKLYMIFFNEI